MSNRFICCLHDTQNAPCQPAFRHSHWIPITNIAFYVYCNKQQLVYFYPLLFLTQTEERLHHGTSLSKTQEAKQHSKFDRTRKELDPLPYLWLSRQLATSPLSYSMLSTSHPPHQLRGQKELQHSGAAPIEIRDMGADDNISAASSIEGKNTIQPTENFSPRSCH